MNGVLSKEEKIYQIIAHVVLIIGCILAVLPFWLLISASFSSDTYATAYGYKFFPKELSLSAYKYIAAQWAQIGRAYGITALVTVMGTAGGLCVTSLFAYGLSQRNVPGVKVVFFMVLLTMLFNGGIVPTYMIYTTVLGVKNTIWGLVLPGMFMSAFNVILVKNYFQNSIPAELIEAAEIDGAGQFRVFIQIVVPLSTPILATVGLMSAVGYWNDWQNGLYYISDSKMYSIQQFLNAMNENIQFMANNAAKLGGAVSQTSDLPSVTIRLAIAVVAVIPILLVYPFFQKYFAKGITMGAVKG